MNKIFEKNTKDLEVKIIKLLTKLKSLDIEMHQEKMKNKN